MKGYKGLPRFCNLICSLIRSKGSSYLYPIFTRTFSETLPTEVKTLRSKSNSLATFKFKKDTVTQAIKVRATYMTDSSAVISLLFPRRDDGPRKPARKDRT